MVFILTMYKQLKQLLAEPEESFKATTGIEPITSTLSLHRPANSVI